MADTEDGTPDGKPAFARGAFRGPGGILSRTGASRRAERAAVRLRIADVRHRTVSGAAVPVPDSLV